MNDEENLQKIMMMGFTDEENIRAVLKSCSSDVNEAISLLASEGTYSGNSCNFLSDNNVVNEQVSEDKCSGRGDTSVEKDMDPLDNMIKGHDISRGFTSFEFNRLQNRISTEQWDIPCLRSQSLGLCLLGTIHEIKVNGLKIFDLYPEAERFLTSCLKECVSKELYRIYQCGSPTWLSDSVLNCDKIVEKFSEIFKPAKLNNIHRIGKKAIGLHFCVLLSERPLDTSEVIWNVLKESPDKPPSKNVSEVLSTIFGTNLS
ncbi:unnamed protein product [Heterobilharzia americana]|nr:unnamed protein product [Heterobilharzia americana]